MLDPLWPHGLQHARFLCPFNYLLEYADSCPLSRWCHPTISYSATWFSFCLQSFQASGSFPESQLFASDGQIIEVSALASVLTVNIQDWFPLELTGLISLQPKSLSRVFSSPTFQKHQFLGAFFMVQFSHPYMTIEEKKNNNIALTIWTFVGKVMSLLFNTLDWFVIAFLPRNKHLLNSWF